MLKTKLIGIVLFIFVMFTQIVFVNAELIIKDKQVINRIKGKNIRVNKSISTNHKNAEIIKEKDVPNTKNIKPENRISSIKTNHFKRFQKKTQKKHITKTSFKEINTIDNGFISYGGSVQGRISEPEEIDSYTFNGNEGDIIFVKTVSIDGLEAWPFTFDSKGNHITNSASGIGSDEDSCFVAWGDVVKLTTTGVFIIEIDGLGTTGQYKLILENLSSPTNSTTITFDGTVTGTFASEGEIHLYTFNANKDDVVFPWLLNEEEIVTGDTDSFIIFSVYDQEGKLLSICFDFCFAPFIVPSSGAYTIIIEPEVCDIDSYRLALKKADNIDFGDILQDDIGSPLELDVFKFSGKTGDMISLFMAKKGCCIDPYVELYVIRESSSDGDFAEFVTSDDNSGGGLNALINDITLPVDGVYVILTGDSSFENTGEYELQLQEGKFEFPSTLINIGDEFVGAITEEGEQDFFSFEANAGDIVIVKVINNEGLLEPLIANIFDPQGNNLAFGGIWRSSGSLLDKCYTNEIIDKLDITGKYTFILNDNSGIETGEYTLRIEKLFPLDNNIIPVKYGDVINTPINSRGEFHLYSIEANENDNLYALMWPLAFENNPIFKILNADGNVLFLGDWGFIENYRFPESGTYIILVEDWCGSEGENTLTIKNGTIPINFGNKIEESIVGMLETDFYSFNGVSGDEISIAMKSEDFEPYLGLWLFISDEPDEFGVEIFLENHSSTNEISFINGILPETGLYIITAMDFVAVSQDGSVSFVDELSNEKSYSLSLDKGEIDPFNSLNADLSANPTEGDVPLTVNFSDLSRGKVDSWQWDFGDGVKSVEQNPLHTYEELGVFTVSLTVSEASGEKDTITRTDLITVKEGMPVADFIANITSGIAPLNVQFIDSSTGRPTGWNWDFGDGETSSVQNPLHTYLSSGLFSVSLTVENSVGFDTTKIENFINVQDPNQTGKSFTFRCRQHSLILGNAGVFEKMIMELGTNEQCTVTLTNLEPGQPVEFSTFMRTGRSTSIQVSPENGITNANGQMEFTISAIEKGSDWIAWAVRNDKGKFEFSKQAYDNGTAWGMFVEVK